MPIHDQGYQRYKGHREAHGRRWWVIARAGIVERLKERRFLALMLFSWAPFVVRAVQMYSFGELQPGGVPGALGRHVP